MMRTVSALLLTVAGVAISGCQTLHSVTGVFSSGSSTGDSTAPAPAAANAAAPTTSASEPAKGGLKGMSSDALRSAWGEPSLKRGENGAEMWQYAGSNCTLLIYLYPGAGSGLTVSHAEAVPGGADDAAVTACAKAAGKPSLKPIS